MVPAVQYVCIMVRKKQPNGIDVEWLRENLMFGAKWGRESNERSKQNRILCGCKKNKTRLPLFACMRLWGCCNYSSYWNHWLHCLKLEGCERRGELTPQWKNYLQVLFSVFCFSRKLKMHHLLSLFLYAKEKGRCVSREHFWHVIVFVLSKWKGVFCPGVVQGFELLKVIFGTVRKRDCWGSLLSG